MNKSLLIGNGQGFWGDSIDAPKKLIKDGPLDYLTLDYLAEVTLSIMQRQKLKDPKYGYAKDFITLMKEVIKDVRDKNIKIITNAGGVNPNECRNALKDIALQSYSDVKIGVITGDDIYKKLDKFYKHGVSFRHLNTKEDFKTIQHKIYSANVYIDSFSIADALSQGAQIVLAGRVSDPGLTLGPCIYEYGWGKDDYDLLASGTLAGHIIECGAQCTGGNYTKWKDVKDLANIGYPIAEIYKDGRFNITKHKNTGGIVNKETILEQVLYEMGDPKSYISPDVIVDFTSFRIKNNKKNNISVTDVKGKEGTDSYKVSISYFGGYKATGQLTISAPDAIEKANLTADIIWSRLKSAGFSFDKQSTELLGISPLKYDIIDKNQYENDIILRLGVKDNDYNNVKRFTQEIAPVITSGPPGITGFSGGRPKVQEVVAYWPTLVPKELINTEITVI